MIDIRVYVNSNEVSLSSVINVSDKDTLEFELISSDSSIFASSKIEMFLEDYLIPYAESADGLIVKSQINHLFRESFGYSNVRVFVDDEIFKELLFNVSTDEEKFNNIKDMMSYLLGHNERVLDICFARTKYKAKNNGEFDASFDSIISLAEKIIFNFDRRKNDLHKELRHRLELIKESPNAQNFYNINPYDVIDNLDKLHQGYSPNSIKILGRVYSLEDIDRENYINSYNLEENKVLLGGLISIKSSLLDILRDIEDKSTRLTYDEEYKKIQPYYKINNFIIEDLYVHLTTHGMRRRIDNLLTTVEELINIFKNKLNVIFEGFLPPQLSPFARKSSFYLTNYTLLDEWYSLGNPNMGVDHELAKIRSTAKIYELFTLYKLIESFHNDGWEVVSAGEHSIFKNFIPAQIQFRKRDITLDIFYEKKILGFSQQTQHNDLVALDKNNPKSKYNYYHPDFILMKTRESTVEYFILDSKYSSSSTLYKFKVLDNLYDKYFANLAIYNKVDSVLDKRGIKCVTAIHPFGDKTLTKWPIQVPKITPDISSIFLSKEKNDLYKILNLINHLGYEKLNRPDYIGD